MLIDDQLTTSNIIKLNLYAQIKLNLYAQDIYTPMDLYFYVNHLSKEEIWGDDDDQCGVITQ